MLGISHVVQIQRTRLVPPAPCWTRTHQGQQDMAQEGWQVAGSHQNSWHTHLWDPTATQMSAIRQSLDADLLDVISAQNTHPSMIKP